MIAVARPPAWRVGLAFVVAPALAAAVASATTLFEGRDDGSWFELWTLFAGVGAFPPALALGVLAWLALGRHVQPGLGAAMLAGGIIAALGGVVFRVVAYGWRR